MPAAGPCRRRSSSASARPPPPSASAACHPPSTAAGDAAVGDAAAAAAPPARAALPAPEDAAAAAAEPVPATTLDVRGGGSTVKLAELGPLVVNQDGSMSRISNWAEMSAVERDNTLRIVGRRNQLRLAALKQSRAGAGSHESDASSS